MKKKALHKEFFREIKKSSGRFISIFFIVAMGVAFYSGIQSAAPDMRYSGDAYYDDKNLMDLKVLSTLGLTERDITALEEVKGVKNAQPGYMVDVLTGVDGDEKVLHMESLVPELNLITVTSGRLPTAAGECFLDDDFLGNYGYQVGDTISLREGKDKDDILKTHDYKIVGSGISPTYISLLKGNSALGTGEVSGYGYILGENFDQEVYSFAYLEADGARELTSYTQEYDDTVAEIADNIKGIEDIQCDMRYLEVKEEATEKLADARTELEDGKREADHKLADALREMEDGEKKLADGKKELTDGKQEIEDNRAVLIAKQKDLDDGKKQLDSGETQMKDGKLELASQESEFHAQFPALDAQLKEGEKALADGRQQLEAGRNQYQEGKKKLDDSLKEYETGKKQLDAAIKEYNAGEKQLREGTKRYNSGITELTKAKKNYETAKAQYDAGKKAYDDAQAQLITAKKQYEEGMTQVRQYDESVVLVANAKKQYQTGMAQLDLAKKEYQTGVTRLDEAKGQYNVKRAAYDQAKALYDGEKASVDGARAAYQIEAEQLNLRKGEYQSMLAAIQGDRNRLGELEQLISAGTATEQQIAEAQALRVSIPQKEQQSEALRQDIQIKETQLIAIDQVLQGQEAQLAGEKQKLDASWQALLANKQELDSSEAKLSGDKQKLDELEKTLTASAQEIEISEQKLSAAKPGVQASRPVLEAAGKEIAANEGKLAESKNVLDQAQRELTEGKKQIEKNEKLLADSKKQIDENAQKLKAGKKEIDKNKTILENAKIKLDTGVQELNASKKVLDDNQALLETREKEVRDGRAQLDSAAVQLASAKDLLASKELELDRARAKLQDGQKQLDDGQQKLKSAQEDLKDGEKTIQENEQKLSDGRKEYEEGKKEADQKISDGEAKIADAQNTINDLESPTWYIQDRNSLPEHTGYGENAQRIRNIGQVFPILFFLVAALISLTTMTRMVEEQRTQIGTMKALGYSKLSIASKYINYALLATIGGSVFGVLIGEKILPYIIINAYTILYQHIPLANLPYNLKFGLISTGVAVICTTAATIAACYKELSATPAVLMRPPAPKEGKRVLLERVGFIWKHLSFTWKSTIRNLFRYKKRFLMTVFGIGGCMALLLVGFGLRDSIMDIAKLQYQEIQFYDGMIITDSNASQEKRNKLVSQVEGNPKIDASVDVVMKKQSVNVGKKTLGIYLCVPKETEGFDRFVNFRNRITKETYVLGDDGIILTEKTAKMMGASAGDRIKLIDDENEEFEVSVAAICENYMAHYGYMSPALYEKVYGEKPEYNTILFGVTEDAKASVESVGKEILNNDTAVNISYTSSIMGQLNDMLSSLNVVIVVLIISAGMLAFVVLYNLNNININERQRELATIKVLGFYDKEVSAYMYRENILLTAVGVILGIVLGVMLHRFTIVTVEVDACMFGRNIKLASFVYSTLFTIGFSAIVNVVMHFKLKKIDMVESLKSVE